MSTNPRRVLASRLTGCLWGTAVGDSVGLPFENLSRHSVRSIARGPLRQSLVFGRGMLSDDTEHTQLVALSLIEAGRDVGRFRALLASRLRWWLLSGPPGVGSATARAILKLWFGANPASSGVHSAGNGPAMRAAILGVACSADGARLVETVRASTCLTHTDPAAFEAALAVAVAAHAAPTVLAEPPEGVFDAWRRMYLAVSPNPDLLAAQWALMREGAAQRWSLDELAGRLGCPGGVTGYALHTVPAALYAWMCSPGDLRRAVTAIIRCGGDTDSTAAIVGGIVGAGVGPSGVPVEWLSRIWAWPRGPSWMQRTSERLADALTESLAGPATSPTWSQRAAEVAWWPFFLLRNLAMFGVVLAVFFIRTLRVGLAAISRALGLNPE